MSTRDYVLGMWKTFVITATGLVAVWLANHGIHLNGAQTAWVTITFVSLGLSAYNVVVNFLLAQDGDTVTVKLARLLGKLLSLGGVAPKYVRESAAPIVQSGL